MDFLSLAKKRRTSLDFSDKNVSSKDIVKILEAGRWAPSCTNTQPWHFIIVTEEEVISELMANVNYGFFHTDPPVLIAAVLEQKKCAAKNHVCFKGRDSGVHDTFMSIGIAIQNMALQATELGINSAILTPDQSKVKKPLRVKEVDAVPLFLALGYEPEGVKKKVKQRFELKDMVSYEYYGGKANEKSQK